MSPQSFEEISGLSFVKFGGPGVSETVTQDSGLTLLSVSSIHIVNVLGVPLNSYTL